MAKVKGKGTIYKTTISAMLTALAQVVSVRFSGAESEVYDSTALDSDVYHTYEVTGYAMPGQVDLELFWDMALAGHKATILNMGTGSTLPLTNAHQVTYADSGNTTQSYTICSTAFGANVVMNDGVKASVTFKITGDPGFPDS
jgi:hypothetical protein